ncbi:hypothetical protein F4678DRAFT_427463 [Xylaria arbuscula]|nr:hypothetical protein F4678DRAFT_427463 [Xylaria arbuscula]
MRPSALSPFRRASIASGRADASFAPIRPNASLLDGRYIRNIAVPLQCTSCLEWKPETDYRLATSQCRRGHAPRTCTACFRTWIQRSLEDRGTRITCVQCPSELDYFAIKEIADEATFERYETLLLNRLLEQDPRFVWCAHACGSGQSHPAGADEPILTCHNCFRKTCVVHQLPWHPGLTCLEFDQLVAVGEMSQSQNTSQEQSLEEQRNQVLLQRARDDEASRELVSRSSKPCPRCHFDIQKAGGCDMMTCEFLVAYAIPPLNSGQVTDRGSEPFRGHVLGSRCGHAFCWLCLSAYSGILRDGNAAHMEGCRHRF